MSINDLRRNDVIFQGKEIRVAIWDEMGEIEQEVFWECELNGTCDRAFPEISVERIDEILEMDIKYIYAVDGVLTIEVSNG